MIQSKEELKEYIEYESHGFSNKFPDSIIGEPQNFQKLLRKTEYYRNCRKDIFGKIVYLCYRAKLERESQRLGLAIPCNVFGKGLRIDSKILHHNNWWIAWGAAIAFAIYAYCRDVNLILNQFYYLLFVLVIVLLSMRVKLDSSTLLWCGQNLLGLYILQRIPMILCKEWKLTSNICLSLFVCIVVTIVLAVAFRKYVIGKVKI